MPHYNRGLLVGLVVNPNMERVLPSIRANCNLQVITNNINLKLSYITVTVTYKLINICKTNYYLEAKESEATKEMNQHNE